MRRRLLEPSAARMGCALLLAAPLVAQEVEVINETFDAGVPAGLSLIGTSKVFSDDGCGNGILSLTQGLNEQAGFAWLENQFDLSDRVEIEFDLFIGRGTSATPADGVSVIFQFDGDTSAVGGGGGGLGVANFRGNNSPYVSVGFDIWDNGAPDPETACDDGRYGDLGSCGTEVNQNNLNPAGVLGSQATGTGPDFIGSGDKYGIPPSEEGGPPGTPGDCDPGSLNHVEIIFDNRLMLVKMSGGVGGDGQPFPAQTVVSYATQALPAQPSNIGFAASTGNANAHQWVDNVIVREGPSQVTFAQESPPTSVAINSGGPAVDATPEIGTSFRADAVFGSELSRVGDIDTGLTITTSRFGRVNNNFDFANVNIRPITTSQIPGAGAETAKLFIDDAWSTKAVHYRGELVPGRYDVSLFWSENFAGAIDGAGRGTKLYDVYLNGTRVLCNWSAASAAGSPTGSGDSSVTCIAVIDTAIRRTFSVDVPDGGSGFGTLDIVVDDLGGGNPPENAALNAVSVNRTGGTTGGAPSGDIECLVPPAAPAPAGVLINEDFDGTADAECPLSMQCNSSGGYTPQVLAGRLRLTEDLTGSTGTTAIFLDTVDVVGAGFRAEFDVYMGNPDAGTTADGGSIFVMEGNNTAAVGPGGGTIGIPGGNGFAIEFDTWQGPETNEPSGFNIAALAFTHVGINNLSTESQITNVGYDPDQRPVTAGGTGWIDFFNPEGAHIVVAYNAGNVIVTASGVDEGGNPFGPQVVAEANVTPITLTEAVVGFSGGTGGATQDLEFDNVVISAKAGVPPTNDTVANALESARQRWINQGELYINAGGTFLSCNAVQFPAPATTGDAGPGEQVVWVGDSVGGGAALFEGEFFSVTPLFNSGGVTLASLQVAGTDMGVWDARGTSPGVDQSDKIFHTERWAAMEYAIPVTNGDYEVTLYFANSFSGTAGTARRVFHVDVEGERKTDFHHCEHTARPLIGVPTDNPFFLFPDLFDPVDEAERLYSSDPCNFVACANNRVDVVTNPDLDTLNAQQECGNAAASALRYTATVVDGILNIALTPPDTLAGEPTSPDGNPKISGLVIKRQGVAPTGFRRGDSNASGDLNITDGVFVLNYLFLGGPEPPCQDAADSDDNGALNITDGVRILNYLFLGGPAPSAPGPDTCGPDPTADDLPTCNYTAC